MDEKYLLKMLIGDIMSEFIGGYENTLEDCDPTDEEYIYADWFLNQSHEDLIDFIYSELMDELEKSEFKHLKFFGSVAIKMLIDSKLISWNY